MRALPLVLLVVAMAGCAKEAPVAAPAQEPAPACEARGIPEISCGAFCALNPEACGLEPPAALPYPSAPVGASPASPTPTNATTTLPEACALLPAAEACPQP